MNRGVLGRRRALIAAAVVGVLVLVLVAVLATRSAPSSSVVPTALLGERAPAVSGTSVTGSGRLGLSSYPGRYVVLDFFASWCPPCQQEAPQLESFLFEHRSLHDVAVLGVVVSDSAGNAASFLSRTGATWSAISDPNGQIALAYGVDDPPQIYLIAPDRRVAGHIEGATTRQRLDALLDAAKAAGD